MRWVNLCGRKNNIDTNHAVICSLHFEQTAFHRNLKYELLKVPFQVKIKKGAVPTLLLPSTKGKS